MRVLFDNGTPRGVAAALAAHIVEEARSRGWDTLKNGELLDAAEKRPSQCQLWSRLYKAHTWVAFHHGH